MKDASAREARASEIFWGSQSWVSKLCVFETLKWEKGVILIVNLSGYESVGRLI